MVISVFPSFAVLCPALKRGRVALRPAIAPLQAETERFNTAWGTRDAEAPLVEFLLAAAQGAQQLYSSFFQRIAGQVARSRKKGMSYLM